MWVIEFIVDKGERKWGLRKVRRGGTNCMKGSSWAFWPQASAALPRICSILSHQEVDLSSHFHIIDAPAGFITFPLSPAARLLIVSPSLNVLNEPVHSEDPV